MEIKKAIFHSSNKTKGKEEHILSTHLVYTNIFWSCDLGFK